MVPSPASTKSARDAFARAVRSVAPGDRSLGLEVGQEGEMQAAGRRRRTPVGRIEREDHRLPAEVGKGDGLVGCGVEGEPGLADAGLQDARGPASRRGRRRALLTLRSPIGLRHVVGLRQERRHAPRRGDGLPEWQILRRSEWGTRGRSGDLTPKRSRGPYCRRARPAPDSAGLAAGATAPVARVSPGVRPPASPTQTDGDSPGSSRSGGAADAIRRSTSRKATALHAGVGLAAASTAGHRRERALTDM
jgi:hypothetical protein